MTGRKALLHPVVAVTLYTQGKVADTAGASVGKELLAAGESVTSVVALPRQINPTSIAVRGEGSTIVGTVYVPHVRN